MNHQQNSNKQLPDIFRELQEIRQQQTIKEFNERKTHKHYKLFKVKESVKEFLIGTRDYSNIYISKVARNNINTKVSRQSKNIKKINAPEITTHNFNAIGVVIGVLFLVLFLTTIKSNYIFATTHDEEKEVIGNFEENDNPIDLMNILSENMSEIEKKDIITEEQIIEREVEYIENSQLPKDEEVVDAEGFDGSKEVTFIRTYENDELLDEKIINEYVTLEPAKKVIQKGTSEYLLDKQVHIGDTMYTVTEVLMMDKPEEDTTSICKIYQYIDVQLDEVLDGWCRVTVDGFQGYVKENALTSASLEPEIVEKSRIQRIMVSLKFDMELNKPSGLTKEDFVKILSGNSQDTNKVFEENAELFYEIEQKYNVNGVLLAAMGIHESAWGTSKIANDKKNLFGYGAYDSSPYASAFDFETYGEGVELLAKVLSKYYLNEAGTEIYDGETAVASFYNGPTVSGINVRYASDPDWAVKVFDKMEMLYEKL